MLKSHKNLGERGAAHILILVAIVGILAYVAISSSAFFKDSLFSFLYPKSESQAAEAPGSVRFVDVSGNTITQTTSPSVKVKYVLPDWGTSTSVSGPITATTKSIVLAEDKLFRRNVKTVGVGTSGPIDYTFSNATLGAKSLYVKFIASNRKEQNAKPFPVSIKLVAPTPSPSPTPSPTPTPTPSPVASKRVFVTGNTYWNTNFGGLNGADNICKTEANNVGLGGNWVAWLSTSIVNAKDRIADAQYKLVDGTVIANSKEDLLDGMLLNPIIKNASNVTVPSDASWDGYGYNNAYTATGPDGLLASDKGTCNDWTVADYNSSVALGGIRFTDSSWTARKLDKCGYSRRLYCFEQ